MTVGPLDLGKEITVLDTSPTAAGEQIKKLTLDAESILLTLFVRSISGDLTVTAETEGANGEREAIVTFPTISAPTTNLLLRKAAASLSRVIITASYTGACNFEVRARGVNAAAASIQIASSTRFQTSQIDVASASGVVELIPAALTDRDGVLIMNNNVNGAEILYIGGAISELSDDGGTTSNGKGQPVYPGGNISVDIQAGATIYAAADSGTIDVRNAETGA